jgi:hypothetical protein
MQLKCTTAVQQLAEALVMGGDVGASHFENGCGVSRFPPSAATG